MRKTLLCFLAAILFQSAKLNAQNFTLQSIKAYPYPTELTASASGTKIAWAFDEQGKRNVYVAEAPTWQSRKLTNYNIDDAQEITSLQISADGKW